MKLIKTKPDKGDPSEISQHFPRFDLQLHCCRYWWLQHWEFGELSFPFWRIYHNNYQGGVIIYEGKEYTLTPDKIVMIAPNTSYATRLYNHQIPNSGFLIKGNRVNAGLPVKNNYILHLFIHFNLGIPYDNIKPGLFSFELTDHIKEKLDIIIKHLNYEHTKFSFYPTLVIQSLITDMLSFLPEESWSLITEDTRLLKTLRFIEENVCEDLSNTILANQAKLATNAFTRLFTQEIGSSPQKYVKKKRIGKACVLLHHSDKSIDEIAFRCGFSDRYHFSRIFKQITNISPASYRKNFLIS
ncbi:MULTISPECIES: helix-turn-helix domain-containing protein [unclassified Saccharicrinis]|uniref:helix-turn-helix domain-containing protein n=1 Tax=unclassified Saccharicrinis TaxID=2646859 RepID=UPI003D326297